MKADSPQKSFQPSWTESAAYPVSPAGSNAVHLLWLDSAGELSAPRAASRMQLADTSSTVPSTKTGAEPVSEKLPSSGLPDKLEKTSDQTTGVGAAPSLNRYEDQIQALERQPHPEDGSAVFVGSSTFARWTDLEKVFKKFDAHDLAFGGSTIPEINHYFDRLFNGYTPKEVVFYAGTNDISELHHSGAQVFQDFQKFEKKFHEKFPKSDLIFVSISAAPSRLDRKPDFDEANRRIQQYMDSRQHCRYVDVTHVMGDHHGHKVDPNLFLPDNLHMKLRGYQRWQSIIDDALEHPNGAGKR